MVARPLEVVAFVVGCVGCQITPSQPTITPARLEWLGSYRGLGATVASLVVSDAEGHERLLTSLLYFGAEFELVSADPSTGATVVFKSPVRGEHGARGLVNGLDGTLYLGTQPTAHLLRLSPGAKTLVDLGRPSKTETYIWELTTALDGRVYGVTSPNAKLVRFTPTSGLLEDLGRMDPAEQYARHVATGEDGLVYVGVGTAAMDVVVFDPATGDHRSLLPQNQRIPGQMRVHRGRDGFVYATAGPLRYRALGGQLQAVDQVSPPPRPDEGPSRRRYELEDHYVTTRDTGSVTRRRHEYRGHPLTLFRIGQDLQRQIFASTAMPARLLRWTPGEGALTSLGSIGAGEAQAFGAHPTGLLMAGYATRAPLIRFASPAHLRDPAWVRFEGMDEGWRPQAIAVHANRAFVGAVGGYGRTDGLFCEWDLVTDTVVVHPPPKAAQGIGAMLVVGEVVVIGTTTRVGPGAQAQPGEAHLLGWDLHRRQFLFDKVPVAGASSLSALALDRNGLIHGIADSTAFTFELATRAVSHPTRLAFPGIVVAGSLGLLPDGRLVGLADDKSAGVFVLDPDTNAATIAAGFGRGITAGFALVDSTVFFASGPDLYQYTFPH